MTVSSDVWSFLSRFQEGGFRPNRYRVSLTFPVSVGVSSATLEKIAFTCAASSIPESTIGQASIYYMGRRISVPGDKEWGNWAVQVYLDNDFIGRQAFETWQDQLLGFRTNVAQEYMLNPINSFATGKVEALDRAGNVAQTYEVKGIFPIQLGEVSLGYNENDTVATQSVVFAINGWESSSTRF